MRQPLYDTAARKRTTSITLNSDLCAKAREAGLNISKIAETALAEAFRQHMVERIRAEVRQEMLVLNAFVEEHGLFPELVREHYAKLDADEARRSV